MNKLLLLLLLGAMTVLGITMKVVLSPSEDVPIHQQGGPALPGDLARRADGVPGDYDDATETLRTLTEMQKKTFEESEKDRAENKALRASMDARIAEGVNEKISEKVETLETMFDARSAEAAKKYEMQISALKEKVAEATSMAENAVMEVANAASAADVPSNQVSLLQTETGNDFGFDDLALNTEIPFPESSSTAYTSIKPIGMSTPSEDGEENGGLLNSVPNPLNMTGVNDAVAGIGETMTGSRARNSGTSIGTTNNAKGAPGEPMYTINDGATLFTNTSMTALMGKVPVGDQLTDPYRLKVITGGDNLAASRKYIAKPIENVIWTGYTAGNAEQSCVRGYLDTVTLVYEDGTISTTTTKKQTSRDTNETAYLGYITDEWGKPCIRGTYYNNGSQYLKNRTGIAALAAGAEGISQVQTEVTKDSDGERTTGVTGDYGAFVGGQALSGAALETLDYVRDRSLNAVDLVYVPTGTVVSIHVEAQIEFNYDPDGRRLSHVSMGVSNAFLD